MLFSSNHSHCNPEAIIPKKTFCAFPINFVWTNVDHLYRGNLCSSITFSKESENCSISSEKGGKNFIAAYTRKLSCLSVVTSTSVSNTSIPCDLNSYFRTFSRSSAASLSFSKSIFALLSCSSFSTSNRLSSLRSSASLPILSEPSSLPFSLFFPPPLSVLSFLPLVFLFVLPLLSSPSSRPLLVLSVFSFLPSFLPIVTVIFAVHNPWSIPLFLFTRHFQLQRPASHKPFLLRRTPRRFLFLQNFPH